MAICLCFECITRFLEMLIALVLSQNITIGSLIFCFIPSNNCLNHRMFEQFTAAATYSASAMDWDVQFFFFLIQETNLFPRKKAPSLVLFLSSIFPAQSTSLNTFKFKFPLSLYYNPYSSVPFKYLMILLIVIM